MDWWVLTYLDIYRPPHALSILAATNNRDHMFMAWSTIKPARQRVTKTVRGLHVFCGYRWIWDTPNIVEQSQPGGTYEHLFGPIPLQPTDPVWFYLFALPELAVRFRQTALFYVPPPEEPLPAARIFNSIDQPAGNNAFTIVQFDSVLYDDYGLYDPAAPDRFTIPAGALYTFGCNVGLGTVATGKASLEILLNGGPAVIRHDHLIEATGWAGATMHLNTQLALRPDDFLQIRVYYTGVGARDIMAYPAYSPHFWIAQIGAYPITPP